ncbi:hypothetical protein EGW08_002480 [Elysia chlorotica]|uniref:Potassium channel domain-containing protein n=1 Tax=Elysia chlorotica TaxID=188477 RepID=A0A433U7J7_ELYCH|nr:hypothetical protein EGW08_002480 [Elysia chlorotica]
MDAGPVEIVTLPSPSSPKADSSDNKKRKRKKTASKEKPSTGKDKKEKKENSSKVSRNEVGVNSQVTSIETPHSRPEYSGEPGQARKYPQTMDSLTTDRSQAVDKASTLPPSPSSPADSVLEESPFSGSRRQHSKSRSRSNSRSRFSGLFKRKKQRSRSEADVREGEIEAEGDAGVPGNEGIEPKHRSRRAKSATSNRTASVVDAGETGTFPRKSNLKRESPYHAYDPRVQPRDRLLKMTVRDAAKEDLLRRVDSGGIPTRKTRQGEFEVGHETMNFGGYGSDATFPLYPEHPSLTSLPREPALAGATRALVHSTMAPSPESSARSSTLPRTLRSKSSTAAPYGSSDIGVRMGSPPVPTGSTLSRNSSTPAFVHSPMGLSRDQLNVSQTIRRLDKNQGDDLANSANSPLFSAQTLRSNKDIPKASGSIGSSTILEPVGSMKDGSVGYNASDIGASSKHIQRKTSLSKFLELRQTQPLGLALTRRTSQSSDSGVTSRDTSPGTSVIRRHTRRDQGSRVRADQAELQSAGPSSPSSSVPGAGFRERLRSNPYVVSSEVIPDSNVLPAPRLYLNGAHLESSDTQPQASSSQLSTRDADNASIDSFAMCPSPNMEESQSSSYRSSDQGFVESETSDADVEDILDDNSDFSTPPEEVEPLSPSEDQEFSMRFATPRVLEKLLTDTQRQIYQNKLVARDAKEEPGLLSRDPNSQSHYVPHGVRRSHSHRESMKRPVSPRRTFRQGPSFSDSAKETTELSESLETLKELPPMPTVDVGRVLSPLSAYDKRALDEDRLSATSTSTLTNIDSVGFVSGNPASDSQSGQSRTELKTAPRPSILTQEKYRRTFSPDRVRKALVPTPEEDLTGPSNFTVTAPQPPLSSTLAPQTSVRPAYKDVSEIPAPKLSPRSTYSSQSVPPASKITPTTAAGKENSGEKRTIKNDHAIKTNINLDSATVPTDSERQPNVERLMGSGLYKTPVKTTAVMLGRGVSLPVGEASQSAGTSSAPLMQHLKHARSEEFSESVVSDQATVPTPSRTGDLHGRHDGSPALSGSKATAFPMIHGLELAAYKPPHFKGESLSQFLQEHARIKLQRQGTSKDARPESPTKKASKKDVKKAKQKKQKVDGKKRPSSVDSQGGDSGGTSPVVETLAQVYSDEVSPEKSPVSSSRTDVPEPGMRILVDKGCQTSSWLLNSIGKTKLKKSKKKAQSFAKAKNKSTRRRRDSSASDTYIPANVSLQRRGATQWSSLGDVRVVAAYEDRQRSQSPDKRLKRSRSDRTAKRSVNKEFGADSSPQGRARSHSYATEMPKPKKLSLTAIILLKNKIAKYKERKSKEPKACAPEPEDEEEEEEEEQAHSDVPSDTMVTIENEINLSKLEISKETDIIDDEIFESDFSPDYSKRHIHFESMPPSEPMQSEEPLPPLPPQASLRMRHRRESTMRERRRKCVSYCKKFVAFLFSHIGLCSLVVAYTIMGGFLFQQLESGKDMDVGITVNNKRDNVIGRFISLASDFQASESNMRNLSGEVRDTLQDFETFFYHMVKDEGYDTNKEGRWSFASSMLYAITVTTTIGFGHVAPKTTIGRLVTIAYAVVGIPLTLLCLTNIGDVMATGFRLLYGKVCCGVCCTLFKPRRRTLALPPDLEKGMGIGRPVVTSNEDDAADKSKEVIHVPTSLCLLLIAGYIFAGAMLFASWEGWDMLTGSYFCFITLSTIGFGDIVPGMDSMAWAQEEKLVLCALYLLLGLSLIAMCFNLVQEDVKAKCKWLGMKLGIVEKPKTPI